MALDWKYSESGKRIILTDGEPTQKKKITGTRLAGVLGLNPWNTPFQMWCEITKAACLPFEDTIYTKAGRDIEPKQIAWTKKKISRNVLSPEEFFGNRFEEVKYDFYKSAEIFGGMWDAKLVRPSGKVSDIFEYKTTKRAEDWMGQPPVYYLIQVLEYAHLEGAKRVNLVVSFLEENDYNHPEKFVVDDNNTQIFSYDVEDTYINIKTGDIERELDAMTVMDEVDPRDYYNIKDLIELATAWYNEYVKAGISPEFDEEKDQEYLDILRTLQPENDSTTEEMIAKANELIKQIDTIKKETKLDALDKQLKALESGIKKKLSSLMDDKHNNVVLDNYKLSRTVSEKETVDIEAMKRDELYDQYKVKESKVTLKLTKTKKKDEEK